jgi:hypothetical protein
LHGRFAKENPVPNLLRHMKIGRCACLHRPNGQKY